MKFPQQKMVKQFIKEDMNPSTIILMGKDWIVTQIAEREFILYEESKGDCKELWSTHIFYNGECFEWETDTEENFASFVNPYLLAIINKKV